MRYQLPKWHRNVVLSFLYVAEPFLTVAEALLEVAE